jgi:hypothetical protein
MGGRLISVSDYSVEVSVKRPQDAAPMTATAADPWTLESASAWVREQEAGLPSGTMIMIGVTVGGPPPQGQD